MSLLQLKGFEFARDIYLESAPFSVDNDILTPTFKLKRNVARDRYQAQIDAMYAGGIGVVAGMVGLKQVRPAAVLPHSAACSCTCVRGVV